MVNVMSNSLTIRAYAHADLPRLHEIRIAAFTPIHEHWRELIGGEMFDLEFFDWKEKQGAHLDEICAEKSGHEVYIGELGDAIVGFIGLRVDAERKTAELGLNAVDPEYQNRGLGPQLYEFALARMKTLGAKMAYVGTGNDASHAPARAAYAKAGFSANIPGIYYYRML
jgi:ribosomal protein S18 acetylase RimI-like enzyme